MGSLNQAKEYLGEKKDLLQKHDENLLRKKFRNHIVEVTKTRKTTMEAFKLENENLEAAERSPFQKSSSVKISKRGELWGIRFSSPEAPTIKTTYKDSSNKTPIQIEEEGTNSQAKEEKDMVRLNTNPYLRIVSDVALVLEEALKLVDSIVKKLFYRKFLPNLPLAGRPKHFHKNWELITELNKRLQNTLFESTCSRLRAQNSRTEQGTERTSASRDRDNAEERCIISDRSYAGGVYKHTIPCGEKGWTSATSDKFEESKFLCVLRVLQSGKFEFTPVSPEE